MRHVLSSEMNNDPPVLESLHYAGGQYPNNAEQQRVRRIRPNPNDSKTHLHRKSDSARSYHFIVTLYLSIPIYIHRFVPRLGRKFNSRIIRTVTWNTRRWCWRREAADRNANGCVRF